MAYWDAAIYLNPDMWVKGLLRRNEEEIHARESPAKCDNAESAAQSSSPVGASLSLLFFVARDALRKGKESGGGKGAAKVCLKVVPRNFPAVKKAWKGQ